MKIIPIIESLLVELSPAEVYDKYYKNLNYKIFQNLVSYDPQSKIEGEKIVRLGKYAKLIIHLYQSNKIKREDLPKVKEYLEYVYKYHIPIDINKVEGVSDIYNLVKKYMNIDTQDLNVILKSLSDKDYKTLLNGENWLILQPLTEKAACYLGVSTQWCTSYGPYSLTQDYRDRENWFVSYNNKGPLYIIVDKSHPQNKFQFHFETKQYMSPEDRQIDIKGFIEKNPEIKNFFFPSFVRKSTSEEIEWESKHLNLLSTEDAMNFLKKLMKDEQNGNPLINAIINRNEEQLNLLIRDDNIKTEIEIGGDGTTIRFYVKKLYSNVLDSIQTALSYLKSDKQDSRTRVYNEFYEGMDDDSWKNALEPIFKEYYDDNENTVRYELGATNYEIFKANFFEGFIENDKIREDFIDGVVDKSTDSFEENLQKEIDSITTYIDVDYDNEIIVDTVNFLKYINKENIQKIDDNLGEILENYAIDNDVDGMAANFYDAYYDYNTTYPKYKDIERVVDKYFNELLDSVESTKQCIEYREKFNMIYDRLFKKQSEYENENVYIKINDLRVNCDDGTVNITYFNKKNNKKYTGNVKIDNLPVYATNYELFESYFNFKRYSITEQSEIKELFGISFDARVWTPVIKSRLRLGNTYIKNGKEVPDLTIIGRDYPKEYKSFPIDQIKAIIEPQYGNGGGYDEQNSGYDQNGKYVVHMVFGPGADDSTINHELRHAYEDFMRISKGAPPFKQSKEGSLLFSGDFEKLMMLPDSEYEPYNSLFKGLYYTSKIERSAYSDTVYDNDIPVIKMIDYIIKKNNLQDILKINKYILDNNWNKFKSNIKIPVLDKFNDYMSFLKWATDEIEYKGNLSLKKLRKVQFHRDQNKKGSN